jgi:catechol-2,3-dioxygenase
VLESSDLVAFVAATDLRRARVFYEQTLGLPVLEQDDFACVIDAHGGSRTSRRRSGSSPSGGSASSATTA